LRLPKFLARGLAIGDCNKNDKKKMNRMISKKEFRKEVIGSMDLALVQFKLEWSGVCQIISPIYEELATSYEGQANFFTVDVEKVRGLDDEYGVMELPTI
jgi:thioredoxin-like negative regulator of GroEL